MTDSRQEVISGHGFILTSFFIAGNASFSSPLVSKANPQQTDMSTGDAAESATHMLPSLMYSVRIVNLSS